MPIGPTTLQVALPPRRRSRAPRKLNFKSCAPCRHASAKCLQGSRPWPEEKCQRCSEKKLLCSEPKRKSDSRDGPQNVQTASERRLPSIPEYGLALLSVLFFLEKAVSELKRLQQEASKLPKYTLERYEARLKLCFEVYSSVTNDLAQAIEGFLSLSADILHSARLDLAAATSWEAHMSQTLERYEVAGHAGIVCAILIEHLDDGTGGSDPTATARFIRNRTIFLAQCDSISSKYSFGSSHTRTVLQSQIFLPNRVLQIPAIWDDVVHNSRRTDCLGRSAWCMRHDAGSRLPWPVTNLGDVDVTGRSVWYLAYARDDIPLLQQLLDHHPHAWRIPGSSFPATVFLPAAAAGGHTRVFQSLCNVDSSAFCAKLGIPIRTQRGMNCLQLAAGKNRRETVEFLCKQLPAKFVNLTRCFELRTALHTAAMYGNVDIVEYLINVSETGPVGDPRDSDYRTALHWAAWAGSVEVVELLVQRWLPLVSAGINDRDHMGNTPLAISIINNFGTLDVARCLVGLNSEGKAMVDLNRPNMDMETPLDQANYMLETGDCDAEAMTDFVATMRSRGAFTGAELDAQEMESDYDTDSDISSPGRISSHDLVTYDCMVEGEQSDEDEVDMTNEFFDFDSYFP